MKEFIKTEGQRHTANFALQAFVASTLTGLVFYCVWGVMNGHLKADSAVVGSAFTMFIVLVNFCFPNSIGAQQAQDTISKLASSASAPLTETVTTTTSKDGSNVKSTTTGSTQDPGAPEDPIAVSGVGEADTVSTSIPETSPADTQFPSGPPTIDGLGQETKPGS